ncbi:hypothetical protein P7C73_g118, partial [Tremellales sp. Uapishka_1]
MPNRATQGFRRRFYDHLGDVARQAETFAPINPPLSSHQSFLQASPTSTVSRPPLSTSPASMGGHSRTLEDALAMLAHARNAGHAPEREDSTPPGGGSDHNDTPRRDQNTRADHHRPQDENRKAGDTNRAATAQIGGWRKHESALRQRLGRKDEALDIARRLFQDLQRERRLHPANDVENLHGLLEKQKETLDIEIAKRKAAEVKEESACRDQSFKAKENHGLKIKIADLEKQLLVQTEMAGKARRRLQELEVKAPSQDLVVELEHLKHQAALRLQERESAATQYRSQKDLTERFADKLTMERRNVVALREELRLEVSASPKRADNQRYELEKLQQNGRRLDDANRLLRKEVLSLNVFGSDPFRSAD